MEFHRLRYFCAIADSGGFSRAARLTHVSQPSLSQQIHKLEEELGAQLFDRIGRTVRLTELGRAFLPRARALLSDLEAARSTIVEGSTSITGSVCVGVIPTIAPYFLPPWLAGYFFSQISASAGNSCGGNYNVVTGKNAKRSHRCGSCRCSFADARTRVSDISVDRGETLRCATQASRAGKATKHHARRIA